MLKLFDRYVLRDILPPFGLGLLIYSFVLMANQLLQFPELFIARGVAFGTTMELLLYLVPAILAFTVPMAVIMGILAGLGRMSSDSESVAFKSLGIGPVRMMRPLAVLAFLGWAATSVLTLYVTPLSNYRWIRTVAGAVLDKVQFQVNPREFNATVPDMTLYLQDIDPDGGWRNVFLSFAGGPLQSRIVLASRGRLHYDARTRRATVELFDAVQHECAVDEPELYDLFASAHMEREIDISSVVAAYAVEKRAREKTIGELRTSLRENAAVIGGLEAEAAALAARGLEASSPERSRSAFDLRQAARDRRTLLVESHKRFALPFVCWIFVLLGLPLGLSTRKGGRASGFTISLVIILVYYVLLTAGEKLAMDGRIAPWLGMWGGNIILSAASLVLFARAVRERPLLGGRLFRPPAPAEADAPPSRARVPRTRRRFFRAFRIDLPFPGILDRYFIRRYAFIGGLIVLSVLAVFSIVTFFDRLGSVYEHEKPIGLLLDYIRLRWPEFLQLGLPMTALMATLLTLGLFSKFNEITAMKACGISIYRAVAPALALAVLVGGLSFAIQEKLLPEASRKAEEIWDRINDVPPRSQGIRGRRWVTNKTRDRFFHYEFLEPETLTFGRLWIFEIDTGTWSLKRRVFAERARLADGVLNLENGWIRTFAGSAQDAPPVFFEATTLPLAEKPGLFLEEAKAPAQMTTGELGRYIREVEDLGLDTTRLRVDWRSKPAFPFVALVMTLLGIPFAFAMGRKGALVGIGVSLAVALVFWVAIGVFKSLGYVGILPVFLAAWGPNLLFGLLGLFLITRLRT